MSRQMSKTPRDKRGLREETLDMNDWAGADAGKYTYEEMAKRLDRLREEDRDQRIRFKIPITAAGELTVSL